MTLLLIILLSPAPQERTAIETLQAGLQEVFQTIVATNGQVDYALLNRTPKLQEKLQDYADFMATLPETEVQSKPARIALYSNAYNVFTLLGVNRAWPVKSVREIRPLFGFFTKKEWPLAGRTISLNNLEKKILRPLDVRIHFIINCASASCPKLQKRVLTASNVEEVMEEATRTFLTEQQKNRFDKEKGHWQLSPIFDWYRGDWGKKADVYQFIRQYRKDLAQPQKVTYLKYDWQINAVQIPTP